MSTQCTTRNSLYPIWRWWFDGKFAAVSFQSFNHRLNVTANLADNVV